jgi:hypothetical protein
MEVIPLWHMNGLAEIISQIKHARHIWHMDTITELDALHKSNVKIVHQEKVVGLKKEQKFME